MRPAATLLVACATLFATSCTATRLYDGPALAPNEVVRVAGSTGLNPIGGPAAFIVAFDGTLLDSRSTHVEFLPGRHAVTAEVGGARQTFEDDYEAGQRWDVGVSFSSTTGLLPELFLMDVVE